MWLLQGGIDQLIGVALAGVLRHTLTVGHLDCNKPNSIKGESGISLSLCLCDWIVCKVN